MVLLSLGVATVMCCLSLRLGRGFEGADHTLPMICE